MAKADLSHETSPALSPLTPSLTLFEQMLQIPATLLPEQFFTPTHESHVNWTGERLLMLAVLQEAVHSYLRYATSKTHRGKRLFGETCNWFWSQERDYLYSFESICSHLHLDPDYVRRGLRRCPQSTESRSSAPRTALRRKVASGNHPRALAA